ncbi:MAG: hypothetical protein U9Q61_02910 [Thermodesulfobacteriota bacterium]|nr:hypothetical protein [Thermodesulfobacteriota bacterium]
MKSGFSLCFIWKTISPQLPILPPVLNRFTQMENLNLFDFGLFSMIPCGAGCDGDDQSQAGQQLKNFADFCGRLAPLYLTNQT